MSGKLYFSDFLIESDTWQCDLCGEFVDRCGSKLVQMDEEEIVICLWCKEDLDLC